MQLARLTEAIISIDLPRGAMPHFIELVHIQKKGEKKKNGRRVVAEIRDTGLDGGPIPSKATGQCRCAYFHAEGNASSLTSCGRAHYIQYRHSKPMGKPSAH